jgi:hypothetical protein
MSVRLLIFNPLAEEKLAGRGISTVEANELVGNTSVTTRNPHPRVTGSVLLIGRTNGGRPLTLALYPTFDESVWMVASGWDSKPSEISALERATRPGR